MTSHFSRARSRNSQDQVWEVGSRLKQICNPVPVRRPHEEAHDLTVALASCADAGGGRGAGTPDHLPASPSHQQQMQGFQVAIARCANKGCQSSGAFHILGCPMKQIQNTILLSCKPTKGRKNTGIPRNLFPRVLASTALQ